MDVKDDVLKLLTQKAGAKARADRGWCERHGHYCVQLEVNRTAARIFGSMLLVSQSEPDKDCMLTVEEKTFLSNAGSTIADKGGDGV